MSNLQALPARWSILGFALRLLIGWHFFYEGLYKLLDPGWSSAPYLSQTSWLFSGIFHWIAATPQALWVVDLLNMWGLTIIGCALVLGFRTRTASLVGSAFLLFYFVSNPPFSGYSFGAAEGHYLFVNKTLVELAALILLATFPSDQMIGFDRLFSLMASGHREQRKRRGLSIEENQLRFGLSGLTDRRELLKNLTVIPAFGGLALLALKRHGWGSYEESNLLRLDALSQASVKTPAAQTLVDLKSPSPTCDIRGTRISRMVIGGNLVSGFAHARDLIYVSPLLKAYFSDDKVMETLWLCESCGIDTAVLRTDPDTIRILTRYWKRGGKIQWLAQVYPNETDVTGNIDLAIDNGAMGAFVQGGVADRFVKMGRMDLMEQAIHHIGRRGVLAGTAGHMLRTISRTEEAGIGTDFYMKTLHHARYWSSRREDQMEEINDNTADNYWCMEPEETIRYMESIRKPWIAYKVLAAGAISPEDGLRYAFNSGADLVCVGMFDFQIVQNVNLVTSLFEQPWQRTREWMA